MKKLPLQVKVLDKRLLYLGLPAYGTEQSAGLDLRVMGVDSEWDDDGKCFFLCPGQMAMVKTGLAVWINNPEFVGKVYPRSSMGRKGIKLANTVGIIDSDYQGEILLCIKNDGDNKIKIDYGERIAQLILTRCQQAELIIVDEFDADTARGAGGFGHTGSR
jgi:dUTP pyrophosphatase